MNPALDKALAPIVADIENSTGWKLGIEEIESVGSAEEPWAMVRFPDGTATGVTVDPYGDERENLFQVVEYLQVAAIECQAHLGRPGPWPACPIHGLKHSLNAGIDDAARLRASWICSRNTEGLDPTAGVGVGINIAPVGGLGSLSNTHSANRGRRRKS